MTYNKAQKTLLFFYILSLNAVFTSGAQQIQESLNSDTRKLFHTIDANSEKHLDFLKQLIRAQRDGEEAVQSIVAERFRKLGCKVETLKILPANLSMKHQFAAQETIPSKKRVSVVGTFQSSNPGKSLLLFAHPDGPDITDIERWKNDPFAGSVDGNRIYGWGVADDLAGVAIMAEALDALLNSGFKPAGDIILCSTPAKKNAQGVIALLSKGYKADASVYLHPAESGVGMREIKAIASGMLQFRIKVSGQQPATTEPGKTAFAHLGINAIDKALLIINSLKTLDSKRGERVYHKAINEAVGRSTNLLISSLSAGSGLTQVPEQCVIGASITFPPHEKLNQVQREIEDCISSVVKEDPWLKDHPPSIEWLFGTQGVEIPVEHQLYKTVSNAIKMVTGETPFVNPLHSASDIRNPILFSGIPTVGFGPLGGDLTQNGGHDEWVDVPDLIRTIKVTAQTILDWCR